MIRPSTPSILALVALLLLLRYSTLADRVGTLLRRRCVLLFPALGTLWPADLNGDDDPEHAGVDGGPPQAHHEGGSLGLHRSSLWRRSRSEVVSLLHVASNDQKRASGGGGGGGGVGGGPPSDALQRWGMQPTGRMYDKHKLQFEQDWPLEEEDDEDDDESVHLNELLAPPTAAPPLAPPSVSSPIGLGVVAAAGLAALKAAADPILIDEPLSECHGVGSYGRGQARWGAHGGSPTWSVRSESHAQSPKASMAMGRQELDELDERIISSW